MAYSSCLIAQSLNLGQPCSWLEPCLEADIQFPAAAEMCSHSIKPSMLDRQFAVPAMHITSIGYLLLASMKAATPLLGRLCERPSQVCTFHKYLSWHTGDFVGPDGLMSVVNKIST